MEAKSSAPRPWEEATDPRGVGRVGAAVRLAQVGLLHDADL